jgi:hypothetical protein
MTIEKRSPRIAADTRRLITKMNDGARSFWDREAAQTGRLAKDEIVFEGALENIGGPVLSQKTIELALRNADRIRRETLSRQAKSGGRARKADTLHTLIDALVFRMPGLTGGQLLDRLRARCGEGVIVAVHDDQIEFVAAKGDTKFASITGLKDRLTNARKRNRLALTGSRE